jgi:peroxiredoxin
MTPFIALALILTNHFPSSAVQVGDVAPNFTLPGSDGKVHQLKAERGHYVVLEWTNKDCPFVRKHYESGNMQKTQSKAKGMGAVWYTIISSAPGMQGYLTKDEVVAYRKTEGVNSVATLLDPNGTVGHLYGARTTPQIVIIDPKGKIIYDGGIDDRPTPDPSSLAGATNYALQALKEAMAGKPVSVPISRPYGCSVKYAH